MKKAKKPERDFVDGQWVDGKGKPLPVCPELSMVQFDKFNRDGRTKVIPHYCIGKACAKYKRCKPS